jgi:GntR family transcriptional repressor for pyruvate dehydrogenase complex
MQMVNIAESPLVINYLHADDKIMYHLRCLIMTGQLQKGDPLPTVETLVQTLSADRRDICKAMYELEKYHVLRKCGLTYFVSETGIKHMDHVFLFLLRNKPSAFNFIDKSEVRLLLETYAVKSAAAARTENDIRKMQEALSRLEKNACNYDLRVDDDLQFHLRIIEASKESFLISMYTGLLPDCFRLIDEKKFHRGINANAYNEHKDILIAVIKQDVDAAEKLMIRHLI